jgi:hypothetical protein
MHWLEKAAELLQAPTADLRELAYLAGADPKTFYRGISLKDVDVTGQNIEGLEFLDVPLKKRKKTKRRKKPNESTFVKVLKSFEINKMSTAERSDLTKKLRLQDKELKRTIKIVDGHLKKLATRKRKVGKKRAKSAGDFADEFVLALLPLKATAIVVREDKPRPGHDFNWVVSTGPLPPDAKLRYEKAIIDVRRRYPRLNWKDTREREGDWRVVQRWVSDE